jgi:hypothetical protein
MSADTAAATASHTLLNYRGLLPAMALTAVALRWPVCMPPQLRRPSLVCMQDLASLNELSCIVVGPSLLDSAHPRVVMPMAQAWRAELARARDSKGLEEPGEGRFSSSRLLGSLELAWQRFGGA